MNNSKAIRSVTAECPIPSQAEQTVNRSSESDDDKIDRTAREILERYLPAFKELAK